MASPLSAASAYAKLALNMNLAGMFLHNSVADGQTETGAFMRPVLRLGLRREEGIVDAVEMFFFDAATGVLDAYDHASCAIEGGNLESGIRRSEHRVLCIEHEIENDLLQFALVAVNARQIGIEVRLYADLRSLELMLEQ